MTKIPRQLAKNKITSLNLKNKKKYRNFSFYNCNSELPKPVSKLPRMKEIKIILDKNNIFHHFKHISKEKEKKNH